MEHKENNFGFTLIEILIVIAIIAVIAVPILRLIYHEEISDYEDQTFNKLGIGQTARVIVLGTLGCILLYFRFKPDILQAKRKNIPIVGKPVIYFGLVSIGAVALLFVFEILNEYGKV